MKMNKMLSGEQQATGGPKKELKAATNALAKAIEMHRGHMDDMESMSENSQKQMMSLMQRSYVALAVVKEHMDEMPDDDEMHDEDDGM